MIGGKFMIREIEEKDFEQEVLKNPKVVLVDFFATWWDNQVYLVPVSECSAEKTLWIDKPSNPRSCYSREYIAEEVLKNL